VEEFYKEAMKHDNGLILNILDIPLGQEYWQCLPYKYWESYVFIQITDSDFPDIFILIPLPGNKPGVHPGSMWTPQFPRTIYCGQ
jgi:hypothetical protein